MVTFLLCLSFNRISYLWPRHSFVLGTTQENRLVRGFHLSPFFASVVLAQASRAVNFTVQRNSRARLRGLVADKAQRVRTGSVAYRSHRDCPRKCSSRTREVIDNR